ncbi:MAG: LysR family transcriptional regulator [Gammaproteobacteria bacterium]|nr:LysR family transcriptional regulator [Gammaproteobacteria bacterium]MCW5582374.1 LysR family transcriptional regulator [Gammaproteobacteria bacterium]
MKLDQLHYFVETARRQHIGRAASFLHISPSAISHSITALEEELGKSLFVKHGRQIKLTAHGKILLDRAEFLLAEVERIREELSSDQLKMRGHYRIAATHVLCSEFLTPVWINIQKEHPSLTATLYSLRSGEVLSRVNASEVDLGICFCPHSGPNHEQEIIHRGKLVFCFGKKHPFLKNRRLKDIEQYPSIATQASQGIENCENHPSFQKLKIRPKVVNLFDSYDVAIRALKSNAVWALLPDFLAYSHRTEIETYIPRGWNADYSIAAIWPKYHIRTQALDCVIEKMSQIVKETASQWVSS